MKIYLDCIDPKEIAKYWHEGFIDGITTNPSLMAKAGHKPFDLIKQIAEIVDTSISVQITAIDLDEIIKQAEHYITLGPQIVIKLPCNKTGFIACKKLADKGIRVNMTLCFSLTQALLAAKMGAAYVSPFIGRMNDNGYDGIKLIEEICQSYANYPDFGTQVLAASIRDTQQIKEVAKIGVDVVTISTKLLEQMIENELTLKGQEKFMADFYNMESNKI